MSIGKILMQDAPFLLHTVFQPKNLEQWGKEAGVADDPFYKSCKLMEAEFSDLVDVMRQEKWLPLPQVNGLMSLFWRLVGNRIAPAAMTGVPTVSFWCEMQQRNFIPRSIAVIMVPEKWHDMIVADAHTQMGALVFVASQAKDYWNHKFLPGPGQTPEQCKKECLDRAWSHEAELLHYFQRTVPDFKPNDYQKHVMEKYPYGVFESIDMQYCGREYDGVFPPFPVDVNNL